MRGYDEAVDIAETYSDDNPYGTSSLSCGADWWRLELTTGGWSENEDRLKSILSSTWSYIYWQSSHRGGWHVFGHGSKV